LLVYENNNAIAPRRVRALRPKTCSALAKARPLSQRLAPATLPPNPYEAPGRQGVNGPRSGITEVSKPPRSWFLLIRGEEEGNDPHRVAALGLGEGSQDDGIEGGPGPKEEAALERPAGYFDQGA
jgi:hypothetical protein